MIRRKKAQSYESGRVYRNPLDIWEEISTIGKIKIGSATIFAADTGIWGVDSIGEPGISYPEATTIVSSGLAIAFARSAVREYKKNKRNEGLRTDIMVYGRDFSSRGNFSPYQHTSNDKSAVYQSPFPVTVLGIRNELLGAGKLIGCLENEDGDEMPIVSIEDPTSPTGEVELEGVECWWAPIDDEISGLLATDEAGRQILPATQYIRTLK